MELSPSPVFFSPLVTKRSLTVNIVTLALVSMILTSYTCMTVLQGCAGILARQAAVLSWRTMVVPGTASLMLDSTSLYLMGLSNGRVMVW